MRSHAADTRLHRHAGNRRVRLDTDVPEPNRRHMDLRHENTEVVKEGEAGRKVPISAAALDPLSGPTTVGRPGIAGWSGEMQRLKQLEDGEPPAETNRCGADLRYPDAQGNHRKQVVALLLGARPLGSRGRGE